MKNKDLKIYLAAPRGFCAGVDRAIEIVKKSINKFLIHFFSFFSKRYSSNICGKVKDAKPINIIFDITLSNS